MHDGNANTAAPNEKIFLPTHSMLGQNLMGGEGANERLNTGGGEIY